jgi:hypothetical protein
MNITDDPAIAVPAHEAVRREPIAWLEHLNKAIGMLVEVPPHCWCWPRSACC